MKSQRLSLLMLSMGAMTTAGLAGPAAGGTSSINDADCGGESCIAVVRGAFDFLDRNLHGLAGNGRSCADCHVPQDGFQLSPANAEARFQRLQARRQWNKHADDPLFRAIDADDFRLQGELAS